MEYLEIPVDDVPLVAVIDGGDDLPELAAGHGFRHPPLPGNVFWKRRWILHEFYSVYYPVRFSNSRYSFKRS